MPRRSLRLLLLALTTALFGLLAIPAAAEDAQLGVNVTVNGTTVTVTGTLSAGGQPLKKQDVVAYIDGVEIGRDQTRGNGQFAVEAAVALTGGQHTATVRYEGSGGVSGTQHEVSFETQGQPPAPSDTQAPASMQMTLTASAPEGANNGEMVSISGALQANGAPVGGAGISVADASGDVADSYTVTGADGTFQTMYLVPEDQAEGALNLTLTFAASGSFPAASRNVVLPITHLEVEADKPAAVADDPTKKAATSGTPQPPSSPATPSAAPQTAAGTNTPATDEREASPMTWFVVSLLAIAALAVVALIVMVARVGFGRRRERSGEGAIDFLDDELDDDYSPFIHDEEPTQFLEASLAVHRPAETAPVQTAPVQAAPVQAAPVQTAPVQTEAVTQQLAPLAPDTRDAAATAVLAPGAVVDSPDFDEDLETRPAAPRRGLPVD